MSRDKDEGLALSIDWTIPSDIKGNYATHLVVQHSESEFILSFFEIYLPIVLGTPEEKAAQLKKMKSVTARCVARIIGTPDRMQDFINIMTTNLRAFEQSRDTVTRKGKRND